MAQINALARFLSGALEWKVRYPATRFYGGLKYEPFIYDWARRTFPDYSRFYPDNEEFTQKLVKDLRNKDAKLLAIINPQTVAPEQEIIHQQFQQQADLENQQVEAANIPSEVGTKPISYAPIHLGSFMPPPPLATPTASQGEAADTMETAKEQAPPAQMARPPLQVPKIPLVAVGGMKNLASRAGIFFKRNVGRFLTLARAVTGFTTILGGIVGSTLGPFGTVAGAGVGFLTPSFIKSGTGLRFLSGAGNGVINFGQGITYHASRLSVPNPSRKVVVGFLIGFFAITLGAGIIPLPGQEQQPAEAAPVESPSPTYGGKGAGIIGCPLNNGRIVEGGGSIETGGHCSPSYQTEFPCSTPDTTGRSQAIDVVSLDRMVYLPTVAGQTVSWFVETIDTNTSYISRGVTVDGGYAITVRTESGGKTYRIRFVHINEPLLKQGQQASSGILIGTYRERESHVHITIQEDGMFKPADTYFKVCTG